MLTPGYILDPVRQLLGGIELDPCTEPDNPTGAANFYCLPIDGCGQAWNAKTIFCNPPYGQARDRWIERCIAEAGIGARVVLLIPAHTETRSFQRAMAACTSILFPQGRIKFGFARANGRQEAASHGSALIGFNIDLSPLSDLGAVMVVASASRTLQQRSPI